MANAKDNAVVPATQAPPPALAARMRESAGRGTEQAGMEAVPLPFLRIVQDMSPITKTTKPDFIEGAAAGMFFNTASRQLYPGSPGVLLVPFWYQQRFIEWEPDGGGFVAEHTPVSEVVMKTIARAEGKLDLLLENGNVLNDTKYHFCVQVYAEDPQRWDIVLVTLAVSQIKYSKRWTAELKNRKWWDAENKCYQPFPSYGSIYSAESFLDRNKKDQEYFSWKFSRVKDVENEGLYLFAEEQWQQAQKGMFRTDPAQFEEAAETVPQEGTTEDGAPY